MYKKLLSFKRRSTDEISSGSYKQLPVEQETETETETQTNCNCCALCCPQTPCQLCTASFILPSCVGAIRAFQALAERDKCCTSGSGQWSMPATDSMTISKLHVTGNSHCCPGCC